MRCPLEEANPSRKRAWRQLQKIRKLLALVTELPPVTKPPSFDEEGAALRKALSKLLLDLTSQLEALEKAVVGIRPLISNAKDEAGFPHALMALNRAAGKPPPCGETLLAIRQAAR